MITLEPLSERNFEAVTKLEVAFEQAGFVAPNVFSIAESKVYNYLQPRVICRNGRAAGFALYGLDPESQRYYIVRLMVGAPFQGKGIGRTAVQLIVREIQTRAGRCSVYLSVLPGNDRARRLYEGLGFVATGAVDGDGELEYRLDEDGVARLCAART
jgi:diamine N-acetyltransferase